MPTDGGLFNKVRTRHVLASSTCRLCSRGIQTKIKLRNWGGGSFGVTALCFLLGIRRVRSWCGSPRSVILIHGYKSGGWCVHSGGCILLMTPFRTFFFGISTRTKTNCETLKKKSWKYSMMRKLEVTAQQNMRKELLPSIPVPVVKRMTYQDSLLMLDNHNPCDWTGDCTVLHAACLTWRQNLSIDFDTKIHTQSHRNLMTDLF